MHDHKPSNARPAIVALGPDGIVPVAVTVTVCVIVTTTLAPPELDPGLFIEPPVAGQPMMAVISRLSGGSQSTTHNTPYPVLQSFVFPKKRLQKGKQGTSSARTAASKKERETDPFHRADHRFASSRAPHAAPHRSKIAMQALGFWV